MYQITYLDKVVMEGTKDECLDFLYEESFFLYVMTKKS
jgi:hypothetical protein